MQMSDVYALDPQQRVWRRADAHAFAYSDGDAVEQRIRDIVLRCQDPSVLSEELARVIDDWPTLYHLGKGRINLLRPIDHLLQGRTLEIGCGCGAITRGLGELGGQVIALEGSAVRAGIAASRCRDLANVQVVCDSFDQFEADELFDVVTLIGVLEYARKYFNPDSGQDPVLATIARAKSFLRPGGTLVIAIENQLGLKYFAGSPEDHNGIPMYGIEDIYGPKDAVTFGKQELGQLLRHAGLRAQQWWYPFPDYKFPVSILSEAGVCDPQADLSPLLQNSVLVDPQPAPTSFSLESAWLPVFRNGLAGALANSFLVLASAETQASPDESVLAYHYASNRRSEFAKQVAFVSNKDGEVTVRHASLFGTHVDKAVDGFAIEFEEAKFIAGRHWQKELVRIVNRPGWTVADMEAWARVWFQAFVRHAGLDADAVLDKKTPVAGDHFDAVPRNLIVKPSGAGVFFDQEWRMVDSIPLGLVIFRGLGLSFFGVSSVAEPGAEVALDVKSLLMSLARIVGVALDDEDLPSYIAQEKQLQQLVAPESPSELTLEALAGRNLNVRTALWNPERWYRLEADVARRDEQLVDLGVEVHRLEQIVRDKDVALHGISATLSSLYESLAAKEAAVAQQTQEIQRLEAFAHEKQQVVQLLSEQLRSANEEVASRRLGGEKLSVLSSPMSEEAVTSASLRAQVSQLQARLGELEQDADQWERDRQYFYAEVDKRDRLLATDAAKRVQLKAELTTNAQQLQALKLTRWFRLREVLLFHPFGVKKFVHAASIVAGAAVPQRLRSTLVPRLNRALGLAPSAVPQADGASGAYRIKEGKAPRPDAPKVAHVIANFMTGGSSRLVVDLIENLGADYRHVVFTSFNPDPPAYVGLDIEECRSAASVDPFTAYFMRVKPDLVHVHYWGDCDEPWYAQAISAAGQLGLPIIENINTPIEPYRSAAVARYVYVSDYVRSVFGDADARHVTVYPGSDFELFTRPPHEHAPEDCVGMVYRLEHDKLNEAAIQPFIEIARLRPATRILIVGGGSLLEPFQAAVHAAGVADRFEFTGYVSYDTLPGYYRRMSVFIAPVWKESFGQVSPFAMSMKVPVIGYDIGAIGEIVGERQLLAPAADALALAQIAIGLLDAPERRRQMAEYQQRRAVDRFSLQAMIAHYARLYAEVSSVGRKGAV